VEAITFGKRNTVLQLAEKRISDNPGSYVPHIYGKTEAGGTGWLYVSPLPFEKLEFPDVPDRPLQRLTETIQHALFSYLWSPAVLFGLLWATMHVSSSGQTKKSPDNDDETEP